MKAFLVLLGVIFCFCENQAFAQDTDSPDNFVTIKMVIKKEYFDQTYKIPIVSSYEQTEIVENVLIRGLATVDCIDCQLTSRYDVFGYAIAKNQIDSINVVFKSSFINKNKCNVDESFVLDRENTKVLKLKCGVNIYAY